MLVYAIIISILFLIVLWRYIVVYMKYTEVNRFYRFSNVVPRRQYIQLADWLRKRKSKFSILSKMELLTMWNSILMTMTKDYSFVLKGTPYSVNIKSGTSQAKYKQMAIELLEELQQEDDLNIDKLKDMNFYIFNIIFK